MYIVQPFQERCAHLRNSGTTVVRDTNRSQLGFETYFTGENLCLVHVFTWQKQTNKQKAHGHGNHKP